MLRKLGVMGALVAAVAVVVSATLGGTASARVPIGAQFASALKKCGKTVTIGVAYPETGPVASLGQMQWDWASYAASLWNKSHSLHIALVKGDTQLAGNNPQAVQVAHAFASNQKILAVTGPAGSQEVEDGTGVYENAGLANVSGSATRVELTRNLAPYGGHARFTDVGFFYRTVPNDGQQGDDDASYIHSVLKKTKIEIIDDEESYSTGLATQGKNDLMKYKNVTVTTDHVSQQDTDFSSVINNIPSGTQLIFIPWQNATEAQNFYTQLHAHGHNEVLFGSDGTDDPSSFKGPGSYVSGFPVDFSNSTVKAFSKAHSGNAETFGLPSYTATLVNATAIQAACKAGHGSASRTTIRKQIQKVKLTAAQSLLGFPVSFLSGNQGSFQGPGDMGGAAGFGIYQIQANGTYKRVG
jgi:branched-chain amino acid transport system substrate-binding protein